MRNKKTNLWFGMGIMILFGIGAMAISFINQHQKLKTTSNDSTEQTTQSVAQTPESNWAQLERHQNNLIQQQEESQKTIQALQQQLQNQQQ